MKGKELEILEMVFSNNDSNIAEIGEVLEVEAVYVYMCMQTFYTFYYKAYLEIKVWNSRI